SPTAGATSSACTPRTPTALSRWRSRSACAGSRWPYTPAVLASLTGSVTSFVGNHGVYAVFGLMALDAVFPAASELVMVYAGALAAGAFASHVSLFGSRIPSGFDAYLAMALAGTIGYLLGAIVGWAIGFYGDQKFRVSERKL